MFSGLNKFLIFFVLTSSLPSPASVAQAPGEIFLSDQAGAVTLMRVRLVVNEKTFGSAMAKLEKLLAVKNVGFIGSDFKKLGEGGAQCSSQTFCTVTEVLLIPTIEKVDDVKRIISAADVELASSVDSSTGLYTAASARAELLDGSSVRCNPKVRTLIYQWNEAFKLFSEAGWQLHSGNRTEATDSLASEFVCETPVDPLKLSSITYMIELTNQGKCDLNLNTLGTCFLAEGLAFKTFAFDGR